MSDVFLSEKTNVVGSAFNSSTSTVAQAALVSADSNGYDNAGTTDTTGAVAVAGASSGSVPRGFGSGGDKPPVAVSPVLVKVDSSQLSSSVGSYTVGVRVVPGASGKYAVMGSTGAACGVVLANDGTYVTILVLPGYWPTVS